MRKDDSKRILKRAFAVTIGGMMLPSAVILHTLVIISLLAPGLAYWTPKPELALAPASSSSTLLSITPLPSTSELSPTLQQSETSAQESAPTGEIPAAESSPDSDNPADEAELAAYLLAQIPPDSPLLAASDLLDTTQPAETQVVLRLAALQAPQPGATLTLASPSISIAMHMLETTR